MNISQNLSDRSQSRQLLLSDFLDIELTPCLKTENDQLVARRLVDCLNNDRFSFPVGVLFSEWFEEPNQCKIDHEVSESLFRAGLHLYLYVVLQDDLNDFTSQKTTVAYNLATLHLGKSFKLFSECLPSDKVSEFQCTVWKLIEEMIKFDQRLIEIYRTSSGSVEPDTRAYQGKCAVLKATGLACAYILNDMETWKKVESAYDLMAIGNAFCDDLFDWEDDVKNGQNTFVISQAKEKILKSGFTGEPSSEQICDAILTSEILEKQIGSANIYINKSIELFKAQGCYKWASFGESLSFGIREITNTFQNRESYESTSQLWEKIKGIMKRTFHTT